MNELIVNFNRENINVNSGNAWFSIFDCNYDYDFKITGMLCGECNTPYNMVHYRNGNMIFYKGYGIPLDNECYLVMNNGCIYNLTFKNGDLLSLERIKNECSIQCFKVPFFNDYNVNKIMNEDNSFIIYSNDNKELITTSFENYNLMIKFKYEERDIEISANIKDYYISTDFNNDDEYLTLEGFKYYFDGSFGFYSPINLDETTKSKIEYKKYNITKEYIQNISIYEIKVIENLINELENNPDNN